LFRSLFDPSELSKPFVKKETRNSTSCEEQIVDDSLLGLYNYLTAPNIRRKIKHPLFLTMKFPETFLLYYHNELNQKPLAEKLDTLQTIIAAERHLVGDNNKLFYKITIQKDVDSLNKFNKILEILSPLKSDTIQLSIEGFPIQPDFVRMEINEQFRNAYEEHYLNNKNIDESIAELANNSDDEKESIECLEGKIQMFRINKESLVKDFKNSNLLVDSYSLLDFEKLKRSVLKNSKLDLDLTDIPLKIKQANEQRLNNDCSNSVTSSLLGKRESLNSLKEPENSKIDSPPNLDTLYSSPQAVPPLPSLYSDAKLALQQLKAPIGHMAGSVYPFGMEAPPLPSPVYPYASSFWDPRLLDVAQQRELHYRMMIHHNNMMMRLFGSVPQPTTSPSFFGGWGRPP